MGHVLTDLVCAFLCVCVCKGPVNGLVYTELESGLEWGSNNVAFCLSDGFSEGVWMWVLVPVCLCVFVCVCVYAKGLITGLYKQVNWREKSNKAPFSSFNITATSSLHAALTNVFASMCDCVWLHQVVRVCLRVWVHTCGLRLVSLRVCVCIRMFVWDPVFV